MTCLYNLSRTAEEVASLLNGERPLGEVFLQKDPERMFKVVRQTPRTCLAFKILGAGRNTGSAKQVDAVFESTFRSIKPQDAIIVGMYPRYSDEVKENCDRVRRIARR